MKIVKKLKSKCKSIIACDGFIKDKKDKINSYHLCRKTRASLVRRSKCGAKLAKVDNDYNR